MWTLSTYIYSLEQMEIKLRTRQHRNWGRRFQLFWQRYIRTRSGSLPANLAFIIWRLILESSRICTTNAYQRLENIESYFSSASWNDMNAKGGQVVSSSTVSSVNFLCFRLFVTSDADLCTWPPFFEERFHLDNGMTSRVLVNTPDSLSSVM